MIKAKADSTEANFIFDTGAPGLILNLTYFRNYPNYEINESEASGIKGSVNSIRPTTLKKLDLGPIHYKKIIAERVNLGHIENSKGVKVLGLLGLQYFK